MAIAVLPVLGLFPKSVSANVVQPSSPSTTPSPAPVPVSHCPATYLATAALKPGSLSSKVVYLSNINTLVESVLPALEPLFSARPFPAIHEQARLARVPVIMYHDILPTKEVFFDVTPAELEADLQLIREKGLTPVSLDQLVEHLSTGKQLPAKPIVLSFDDGYAGHYTYVLPLLKQYGYPAVFSIYPSKVGKSFGRSSLTWEQLREMAANPLVTIASHSVTHPADLRELSDAELRQEVVESKRILETELGRSIDHFVYPEGKYDDRVAHWVQLSGYRSALTMNDAEDRFAGQSTDLLSIDRIGQSQLEAVLDSAYGGPPLLTFGQAFNFNNPIQLHRLMADTVPLIFASGGQPTTVHADSRYQVWDIMKKTDAIAAVDGGFFSLEFLDSNDMIGPVYSQSTKQFVPANAAENRSIQGRPLVLMGPSRVAFIPYDPAKHNTLKGIRAEMPEVTDAFVAAAWLVKDGQPRSPHTFGDLFDFDAARDRAFWGIDQAGQPVVGVSGDYVDSVAFGKALSQVGLRDAVMLDSGASASLAYQGRSMMSYEPRPVPHVVALLPPQENSLPLNLAQENPSRNSLPTKASCAVVSRQSGSQSSDSKQPGSKPSETEGVNIE
jgi:peptidoglycan/xylan/chitin deacetylase (PgdA/CDA1 family)